MEQQEPTPNVPNPAPLAEARAAKRRFRHFVSFDLGSESSTAYYHTDKGPIQIDLQGQAREIANPDSPLLLRSHADGTAVSKRLRTRFELRDNVPVIERRDPEGRPWHDWGEGHARLRFSNGLRIDKEALGRSAFRFFLGEGDYVFALPLTPNPKIPFQLGAQQVLPPLLTSRVRAAEAERNGHDVPGAEAVEVKYRPRPRDLILHLCAQLLNNLVLAAPELSGAGRSAIHFTLTVPNIYSITHRETLRAFLREHLGLEEDGIDLVYESDAVAYYALHQLTRADKLRGAYAEAIPDRVLKVWARNPDRRRLLTFDVGKGTTDVSLIEVLRKEQGLQYVIQGRTGRAGGGGKLTYLFARYFNHKFHGLQPLFDRYRPWTEGDFLHCKNERGLASGPQAPVLQALEALIEQQKKDLTADYRVLESDELRTLRSRLVEAFFDVHFKEGLRLEEGETEEAARAYLREKLTEAFTLPPELPRRRVRHGTAWQRTVSQLQAAWQALLRAFGRRPALAAPDRPPELIEKLAHDVEAYVEETAALFDELLDNVRFEQGAEAPVIDSADTIGLIAGQASQFRPLQARLRQKLNYRGLAVWSLTGDEAKDACALGAGIYSQTGLDVANPDKVHGGYFFLPLVGTGEPAPVDMDRLRAGEATRVWLPDAGKHQLYYGTVPYHRNARGEPVYGEHALVGAYFPLEAAEAPDAARPFYVELRWDAAGRKFFVNGEEQDVHTFGDLREDIYPKVWPDFLPQR